MNIFSSTYLNILLKAKVKKILNVLPFFKSDKYVTFLIIGHPRTGTSLVHTYLNSHWNVLSLNEPLADTADTKILLKKQSKLIRALGFKYFFEYTEDAIKRNALIALLKRDNIKIIKIQRKNYLRTYLSRCIAEKTNEWSRIQVKEQPSKNKKVILTKENCLHAFELYRLNECVTEKLLKESNVPVVRIAYETLVAQPNETVFAIQKFLGVSLHTPKSLLLRQNTEPLDILIENYNDLKEAFYGTEFEIFFDE